MQPFPQLGWGRSPHELIPALFGANEIIVDPKGGGQFRSVTEALASFSDEAADNWYLIRIAGGSKISDENVVGREFVAIVGDGNFGPMPTCVVSSSSGHTLTAPDKNFLSFGVTWISTSAVPTDSAIHTVDSGTPWIYPTDVECFIVNNSTRAFNGARCFFCDNHGLIGTDPRQVIGIYNGINSHGTGPALYADAASFLFFLGGGGSDQGSAAILRNGSSFIIAAGAFLNSQQTGGPPGTEWAVDADGSFVAFLDGNIGGGDNGIKLRNGSTMFAAKVVSFGTFPGTPIDVDATSFGLVGSAMLNPSGAWINNGALFRLWSGTYGEGTIVPDQRPANPPNGFEFIATDLGGGNGLPLRYIGGQWIDAAGNVIP